MYDKDEKDYNIGFQFRMSKDVFKSPLVMPAPQQVKQESTHVDSMQHNRVNQLVAQGARQFPAREDVIKAFLG